MHSDHLIPKQTQIPGFAGSQADCRYRCCSGAFQQHTIYRNTKPTGMVTIVERLAIVPDVLAR